MSDNAKSRRNKRSRNNRKKNKNKDGGQGSVSQDDLKEIPRIEIETPVQQSETSDVEEVAVDSIECNGIKVDPPCTEIKDADLTADPEIKHVSSYENVTDIQITRLQNYTVQSPERTPERVDKKKLVQSPKSKSLDHDDSIVLDIIEVTELKSDDERSVENVAIVSEAESDAEIIDKVSEKNNIYEDVLVVTSCPPTKVFPENTAPITPEEEHDLRHFVRSLNLTTNSNDVLSKNLPTVPEVNTESDKDTDENDEDDDLKKRRARKKAALEEHFLPQLLYPRFLDVIDEEGSNESVDGIGKRKRDSLKRYDDGDDDVFMPDKKVKEPKDFFPKNKNYSFCKSELKRQQECLLVGAKILEADFEEGCGDWTIEKTEEKRGADIVYLDDSSGSTSEVELTDDGKDIPYADEDERVTIKTPIIEFDTNYHTSGNSVLLPILLNMQSNGNNKSPDNVCKLNGNSRLDSRRVTLTPPPSPETGLSSSEETVEGLESLPLHTPVPVACNEVIMLANDFVDELPVVTELLKNGETENKPEINKIILKEPKKIESTDTDYASSGEDPKDFSRQDSSGSVCSSHSTSHSTAKYNPSSSSLTDINALLHDDLVSVPEPVDRKVAGGGSNLSRNFSGTEEPNQITEAPEKLKDLCVTKVASLPYGATILQELAAVSESLESLTNKLRPHSSVETQVKQQENMFSYASEVGMKKTHVMDIHTKPPTPTPEKVPPPIAPRQSSFRLSREELPRIGLRSRVNPSVVALLTPSQKDQIERKWDTSQDEAGELIDMHKKYIERRGYREYHSDSELKASSSNNIGDKVPMQSPMMRRRVSGTAGYGAAADANRPLASVRDREVVLNVTKNADDVRIPIPDRLRFAETLRSFEDLNENVLDGEKRTFFTKKIDGGNISLDISETVRSDSRLSANIKGGNTDDTDFGLKSLEALIEGLDSKTPIQSLVNGNKEPSTSKERIIKIYQNHSDSEDSKGHVQRLHNRRAFILDDPIFDTKKTNNTEMKKPMPFVDSGEPRRRRSLPRDIQDRQMEYIIQKEREIEEQIKSLEREKWFSTYDNLKTSEVKIDANNKTPEKPLFVSEQFRISKQGDVAIETKENGVKITKPLVFERPISQPPLLSEPSQGEKFRDKMYSEYMDRVAEREDRKHHKVIKMTSTNGTETVIPSREGTLEEIKKACGMIEEEFITKAKQRWDKLGFGSFDDEIKNPSPKPGDPASESRPLIIDHKIKVLDGNEEKDVKKLPSHLREFVQFTAGGEGNDAETVMFAPTFKAKAPAAGVWSPGATFPRGDPPPQQPAVETHEQPIQVREQILKIEKSNSVSATSVEKPREAKAVQPPPPPPPPPPPTTWTPRATPSPKTSKKEFKPVAFESPILARKGLPQETKKANSVAPPPWELRLAGSQSAPAASGLSGLAGTPTPPAPPLPRAQNPTITLLQKAREGQLPRGAAYLQQEREREPPSDRRIPTPRRESSETVYSLRRGYMSEPESVSERPRRMTEVAPKQYEGIGPTTTDGMPIVLRSEVKEANQSKWYKKMYDTIHKNKYDDDYVTVRYKSRRAHPSTLHPAPRNTAQYAYFNSRSGYLSEPEGGFTSAGGGSSVGDRNGGFMSDNYDSDYAPQPVRRHSALDRGKENHITSSYMPPNKYSTLASAKASQEVYKNQPGRIEDYIPGRSSVVDKEAKQWWDEVMDIFDGQLSNASLQQPQMNNKHNASSSTLSKSYMARALKESGYESDSTLVFRRRDEMPLPSPHEQRQAYRSLQAGGEPPLQGFRKPAPDRPKESPRRYVESDVTIHYKSPVRQEPRPLVPEDELARRQADHMRRVYQEERRRKYLQELQDMNSRRHTDNFTPSQKSPISLNRYDSFGTRQVAKALFNFVGQSTRELTFRKGDLILVRRQIDNNWFEGEHNSKVGLFPTNYVELVEYDSTSTPSQRRPSEGRARAKFNFAAQTHLELALRRGELVTLTRRVDDNWYEGRLGDRKGIFPVTYVEVLAEPTASRSTELSTPIVNSKPVASPAAHSVVGAAGVASLGSHHYTPQLNSPALSNSPSSTAPLNLPNHGITSHHARPASATLPRASDHTPVNLNNHEPLYVDTNAEAVPYRAMYKYRPQNPDELELSEGDTVYVLEKCDDGWYVGSSQRTGRFGTFPGNYVERI